MDDIDDKGSYIAHTRLIIEGFTSLKKEVVTGGGSV